MTTLARLSLQLPTPAAADLAARARDLLATQPVIVADEPSRPTRAEVLAFLLEFESPAAVFEQRDRWHADTAWREALHGFGVRDPTVGLGETDHLFHVGLYRTPAGPGRGACPAVGRRVRAGEPMRLGAWESMDSATGLSGHVVTAMHEDRQGRLWLGTPGGACAYDGNTFFTLTHQDGLLADYVLDITEDADGHLLIVTLQGGMSRYDGRSVVSFTREDGLPSDQLTRVLTDRSGRLWIGSEGEGVCCWYDDVITIYNSVDGLGGDHVRFLMEDRQGAIWLTMGGHDRDGVGHGASRLAGAAIDTYTTDDGLAHNHVRAISEDHRGHLWFATAAGACRFDGQDFHTLTTEAGLADNDLAWVLEDGQRDLWFATWDKGVSRYDGRRFRTFTTRDGLAHNANRSLCTDREGSIWFGTTGDGVSRFGGTQLFTLDTADGLASDFVWCSRQDQRGDLWFGTHRGGVTRFDGSRFQSYTVGDGLGSDIVRSIHVDRGGQVWLGTEGGGVSVYDGNGFRTYRTDDGLAGNGVWGFCEDRTGTLWIATDGGVSRFDGSGFANLTVADGLPVDIVRCVCEASDGCMWLGTIGGGAVRCEDGGGCTQFGLANSISYDLFEDRDGDIWIATWGGGVTRYRHRPSTPGVALTDAPAVESVEVTETETLRLGPLRGQSFKTRRGEMLFRCRLCGHDDEWRHTRHDQVEYEAVPVGTYRFELQAVDRDLGYSEIEQVEVVVTPNPRIAGLTEALSRGADNDGFVGRSAALRDVKTQIDRVAGVDMNVLILGETGTGKGLAARAVHAQSARSHAPFVVVNCGAIPEGLVESELFGHEKGAFTGALTKRLGKVELAAGGSLFLDEIGDMPLSTQVKLLQLLEERIYSRVGGADTLTADVRFIAATNRDLQQMVAAGQFREDLFFRLQQFIVELPPLRERIDDIEVLAHWFIERYAAHLDRPAPALRAGALERLQGYEWPGNVRELEFVLQRAVLLCSGGIESEDLTLAEAPDGVGRSGLATLAEMERQHIRRALEMTDGVVFGDRGAALLLGMNPHTLRSRIKKLGLRDED